MMEDPLKKYIHDHRDEWGEQKAPDGIWDKLESELNSISKEKKRTKTPIIYFLSGIAATLALLLVALIGYQFGKGDGTQSQQYLMEEFAEQEQSFQQEISLKMKMLDDYQVDRVIQSDLSELDAIYQELKAELLDNQYSNNQEVIKALKENYETKVQLLEVILNKQRKSNDGDPILEI